MSFSAEGSPTVPFERVALPQSDRGKRVKQRDYLSEGRIPVIDQGQSQIGGYTNDEDFVFTGELPVVLFGDHTRAVKLVEQPFAVGADGIKIFRPADGVRPKYLYYWMKSARLPDRGYGRHYQFLRQLSLPLPEPDRQDEIVAEIEKQFSRLDEAVANLKRVKANLRRYRAAVLKAAVEGCLVPPEADLARHQSRSYESGAELVHRRLGIQSTRASGSEWPTVPTGWAVVAADAAIKIIDYRGRTPTYSGDGIPHLRSSNIRDGQVVWEDLAYVSEETFEAFMTRGLPKKGDLLLTTEAPLGEVALVPDCRFSLAQRLMILSPREGVFVSEFLKAQLMSPAFQSRLRRSGTGSTVTGISSRNFRPLELLVPPIAEQQRISAQVERCHSLVLELQAEVESNSKRTERLRGAILRRLFSVGATRVEGHLT